MKFSNIIGQKNVIKALKNSIGNNRVSHTYIFEGPEGIGKRTVASIFATVLTCEKVQSLPNDRNIEIEACGECRSCIKNMGNSHPDIKIIDCSGKSIGIDEMRDLKKDMYMKPYESAKKVYIITEAHKLTTQAQNALLDVLEDPPEYGVIILNTVNLTLLLTTVLSRAILIKFKAHPYIEIEQFLKENYPERQSQIHFVSMYSRGVIGKAKQFVQSEEIINFRKDVINIFNQIAYNNELFAINSLDYFTENKSIIKDLLNFLLLWLRDALIIRETKDKKTVINIDMWDMLNLFSDKISSEGICNIIEIITDTQKKLEMNTNYALTIEVMLIRSWEEMNDTSNRSAI